MPSTLAVPVEPLRALRPVSMLPAQCSRHMQVVMRLRQLQAVQCRRASKSSSASGTTTYAVEVYSSHRAGSRLPMSCALKKSSLSATGVPDREPDAVREVTFEQVAELRSAMYEAAQRAHPTARCQFCADLCDYILLGMLQPGAPSTRLAPTAVRVRSVDKFLAKVLSLSTSSSALTVDSCECQEQVPLLLSALLLGETQDN